ncbi:hypothetical protein QWY87_16985 [Lutimonas halocynthiae]|uniref:hypothetical protein n=1 Tax=Lutimonas halocynthiae TaxID=1446477 RepID=UPI0025B4931A|nr:hypothetical protein [Lutimonas halocynthiae]MDN3644412.1 hypothetical protein [Lutimonas halocynthiae]
MQRKLVLICLINFFIAALLGLLLRYYFIDSVALNYRFLTHAHSHIAMLGWVYLMLFTLIVHYFIPDKKPIYNRLFWLTEFAVIGMLLSFPFQGYAAVSISFSTLHIICSYYFVFLIWKHHEISNLPTRYLVKASLLFMLISTIGIWFLGPAVSMLGKASAFYQIAIQFFLHFQFNGWFLIAVLAVFIHIIQLKDSKQFRLFFKLLIASTILTLALPVNWYAPHIFLYWINGLGVVIQFFTLVLFLKLIKPHQNLIIKQSSTLGLYLLSFAVFCFALKSALQLVSLAPEFSQVVYQHKNFVIGFIHLLMLGVISGFLIFFILQSKLAIYNNFLRLGIFTFVLGFILTEILLMLQGGMFYLGNGFMPNYYQLLFICSILIPLGILLLIINILQLKRS